MTIELPSRASVRPNGGGSGSWRAVIEAYVSGDLKTAAEYRKSLNYKAAYSRFDELLGQAFVEPVSDAVVGAIVAAAIEEPAEEI